MGNTSFRKILIKFSLKQIGLIFAIFLLAYISFNSLISLGLISQANKADLNINKVVKSIEDGQMKLEDIPSYYDVLAFDDSDKIEVSDFRKFKYKKIEYLKDKKEIRQPKYWSNQVFRYAKGKDYNYIISYSIISDFTSKKLRQILPNFELSFYVFLAIIFITLSFLITNNFTKRLKNELAKIVEMNSLVTRGNLDFEIPVSNIEEVENLIKSFDKMRINLKESLNKQWKLDKEFKSSIRAITHDMSTPLTLICGNIALLEETSLDIEQKEYYAGVKNGSERFSAYIKELNNLLNERQDEENIIINDSLIRDWISLAESIVKIHNMKLNILKRDSNNILITSDFTKVFQNLLENAIEYGYENSNIYLSFEKLSETYRITIENEGEGFSKEALNYGLDRFYTSSKSRTSKHYGLGLAISKEIVEKNSGKIILSNTKRGALVTLIFDNK